jgi:hypothetical protein
VFALWVICALPEGARWVVDAQVLHHLPFLMISSDPLVRRWTTGMLRDLCRHDSNIAEIFSVKLGLGHHALEQLMLSSSEWAGEIDATALRRH